MSYSDGITEAENQDDEQYGWLRLQNHFLQTDSTAESRSKMFANGVGVRDDATVILVKG